MKMWKNVLSEQAKSCVRRNKHAEKTGRHSNGQGGRKTVQELRDQPSVESQMHNDASATGLDEILGRK